MGIYGVPSGADPIAAWIPSLDDAGNGTTTLNDLVGGNNGTLTNMDPATDWISQTDSGGVRAIDIDNTNDKIVASPISFTTSFSVSIWAMCRNTGGAIVPDIIATRALGAVGIGAPGFGLGKLGNTAQDAIDVLIETASGAYELLKYENVFFSNILSHWVLVFDQVSGGVSLYKNASLLVPNQTSSSGSLVGASVGSASQLAIGNRPNTTTRSLNGFFDDVRIFDVALSESDIAYLYNANAGRGRIQAAVQILKTKSRLTTRINSRLRSTL